MITAIYLLSGIIFWTFLEYALHRFLGHEHKGKNLFKKEHLRHHIEGDYFASPWKKGLTALIVLGIITALLSPVAGILNAFVFSFGLMGMYGVYELIHTRAHTVAPKNRYAHWQRKRHFYHHFKNARMNHGVTTPFWDMVFRTNVRPEVIRVPRKMPLKWLIDEESGEIRLQFRGEWKFNGK